MDAWWFYYLKDIRIYPIASATTAEIHGKEGKIWTLLQPPPEHSIHLSKSSRGANKCGEPGILEIHVLPKAFQNHPRSDSA